MRQEALRIGSLCTGYGGLDMAVRDVFAGQFAWCADNDRHAAMLLDTRYPGIPNLGDLTMLDWRTVEPVDLVSVGFPCQDVSVNGRGAGIEKGARSGIWKNIVTGLRSLRPAVVVVENVAGIRYRGLDRVLGDLAEIGYYSVWTSLRASDIGAPHRRERVFILAYQQAAGQLLTTAYTRGQRRPRWAGPSQTTSWGPPGRPVGPAAGPVPPAASRRAGSVGDIGWGPYAEAIRRWTAITGRFAPHPTERGAWGQTRLSPRFSEWLMGLPDGWVTDLVLPYGAQHRILGNGVVPQQAAAALQFLVRLAFEQEAG
jgi:DNA (cytosine-5)-methyltransferase 1